ncbi:glycine-rich domain-containing protein [Bacillus tuaregi]|uniref:hypothetical protein n=1 Tax=Bacillus tuaregi TaxID=1816695 RepID=UPI0008F7FF41|nr:hypothetical protein [Bacillus tuaregi]
MLDGLLGLFVFILIVLMIVTVMASKRKKRTIKNLPLPEYLGIRDERYLPIVQELEQSMSDSYRVAFKNRLLKNHPEWTDYEYEWVFFELKRFFLINYFLKSVPMFSTQVDEIWHEMLMFTKDYEAFSKKLYQKLLHHIPNTEENLMSNERGFFDWVYLTLFDSTPNSRVIWGGFLQQPINRMALDDFRKLSEVDILAKYFRGEQDPLELKRNMIKDMKKIIFQSDDIKQGKKSLGVPSSSSEQHFYQYALGAAVFYSIYEDDQYHEQMNEWQQSEYYKIHPAGASSCTGFACSTSSEHDSGGGHGDASCSSCSSGCSS